MPDPRELVAEMYLTFASELADTAGEAIRPHFRAGIDAERKGDGSPVTAADRAAETAIRERIADRFPTHGVIGEEFGSEGAESEWVWVVDPIDGTGAFIAGLPTFGTLIGLAHEGSPMLGILDQPILRERWEGVDVPEVTRRCTHNSQVIHTAQTTSQAKGLAEAIGFATTPEMFRGWEREAWRRLSGALERVRYGIDCYAYGLLASGHADVVCEASLKLWDWFALPPIVHGAGGRMTDWSGEPLTLASGLAAKESNSGQVLASATPQLHRAAMECLAGSNGSE